MTKPHYDSVSKRLLTGALATYRFGVGVGMVTSPRFWLSKSLHPLSREAVFTRRRDAASFRLDMLGQGLFDMPLLRRHWQAQIREAGVPDFEARPLEEWDYSGDTHDAYCEQYRDIHRPVVFRGLLEQSERYQPWDLDAFIERYGDEEVQLRCPVADGYRGKLRELNIPGVYLHNSERLLRTFPALLETSGFDILPRTVTRQLLFAGVAQLFAGRKKTGSWWHCAGAQNYFLCLAGRKKWTFIDPAYSPWVSPRTAAHARATYYWADGAPDANQNLEQDAAQNAFNRAALAGAPRWEVTLEPGDVLLNPPFVWHSVENVDDATIGMATRWFDPNNSTPSIDVFKAIDCLTPGKMMRLGQSFLNQQLVREDGTVDFDAFITKDEGVLVNETRQLVSGNHDVAAYYASVR